MDFPTSVFPLSDYPTTEMPTTAKKGKARLFMPCPLSSISCRGGCYRPDLKSSKQVVHLRGYLLKVQIYQPFSRTGYILPWQTNKILIISQKLLLLKNRYILIILIYIAAAGLNQTRPGNCCLKKGGATGEMKGSRSPSASFKLATQTAGNSASQQASFIQTAD